jgi:acyl carrier protein
MMPIYRILSDIRPGTDFTSSKDFVADGLLDSFDLIQLVHALESEFSACIPGEAILPENFASIEAILSLVQPLRTSEAV